MLVKNPFNITFGKEPIEIISRKNDLEEIYNSFSLDLSNNEFLLFLELGVAVKLSQ